MVTNERQAILKERIRRSPPSLAGMFYYLSLGDTVYVVSTNGPIFRVSDVQDPAKRISSDYFTVSASAIEYVE